MPSKKVAAPVGDDVTKAIGQRLFEKTAAWAEKYGYQPDPPPETDDQVVKLAKFISKSDFGCKKSNVAGLVSLIVGKKITVKEDHSNFTANNAKFENGVIVVPTADTNSHGYAIGKPYIVSMLARHGRVAAACYLASGDNEASDSVITMGDVRPATLEECQTYTALAFAPELVPA